MRLPAETILRTELDERKHEDRRHDEREQQKRTVDEPTIQELASYTRTTDEHKLERYGAPPGLHDDIVTGAQRAQQMRVTVPGGGVLMNMGAAQDESTWSYPAPQFGW